MKRFDWSCIIVWTVGIVIGVAFWWLLIAALIARWTSPHPAG